MNNVGVSAGIRIYNSASSNNDYLNTGWLAENTFGIQSADSVSNDKFLALQPFGGNVGIGTTSPYSKLFVANGEAFVDYGNGGNTNG